MKEEGRESKSMDAVNSEQDRANDVRSGEFALIKQIVSGEKEEFRILVSRYQNQIFAMIMRQVADSATAEELTQETFLRAYKNMSKFRFQSQFSTWLTRIALNLTNSYFSSRRYKERIRTTSLDMEKYEKENDAAENDGFDKSAIEKLRAVIQTLKPKYREVLVLCALENNSYAEAAGILEIPLGTVRSRLNKARLLLKDQYFRV